MKRDIRKGGRTEAPIARPERSGLSAGGNGIKNIAKRDNNHILEFG